MNLLHPGWTGLVAIGSAVAVRLARAIALKRSLLDVPNEQSSHTFAVPLLGGAAFIPVVLVAVALRWSAAESPAGA